jgi:hypothetical protein
MNFPDRIFAVGGAGKEIAFTILESEWILKDILGPRPDPNTLTVTIIDSAEGERNADLERLSEVRDRVNEYETELRDPEEGRTGSIEVEYKLLSSKIQLNSNIDLLGDDAVERITTGNGMLKENWWLKEDHINENLDFAKGVVRKRGLGKAIYYKSYAEDDEISSYIDLPQKGKVAILAGLGGGTGSGILLDLASHLRDRQPTAEISLFSILPNHVEGLEENTNALAALTELEYVSLQNDQVFKDIVLVPIDPTDFGGKTGDRIQTDRFLEELDQAMVYLVSSYYNTRGLEDPFSDSPQYAPFTIGIPQVLRYRVEAINDARTNVRETLNERSEALQIEEEIYTTVERYLDKEHAVDVEDGLRELDEADLRDRLRQVEELIEFDLFNDLEYQSVAIFTDILQESRQEAETLPDRIELLSTSLRAVDTSGEEVGTFVDNIDEHLAEILEKELQLIVRRKRILEQRKTIDDSRVRDAIEYLIRSGDESAPAGVKLNRLETKLDDLEEQRDRLETELSELEEELEEVREEQSAEVERSLTDWENAVTSQLQQLQQCDLGFFQSELRGLQGELDEFNGRVVNGVTPEEVEGVNTMDIKNRLDRLEASFSEIGLDFTEEKRDIQSSLEELKRARVAFLKTTKEESTIERLTPWDSSTQEEQEEGHKNYRTQSTRLNNKGIFEVGPPTGQFTSTLQFDADILLRDVERREEEIRESVTSSLRSQVGTLDQDVVRRLNTELTSQDPTIDDLREIARDAFWQDLEATDDLEDQKDDLEAELADVQSQIDLYEPTIEVFQSISRRREQWADQLSAFQTQRAKLDGDTDSTAAKDDDYVYIKQIQPKDIFQATGSDDISESDLVQSREESQRIHTNLEELAKNARNQQYTGLQRRKLSEGRTRYDNLKVRVAILSQAIDQMDPEDLDLADLFQGAFDLGQGGKRVESPYTSWSSDVGGPWDIGMSVFISGVFLDNIRKVVQSDGYYSGYETKRDREGENILIHHSYGLEEGFYVRRNELLNMENSDDVGFYLRDEGTIVDDLLDNYVDRIETTGQADE